MSGVIQVLAYGPMSQPNCHDLQSVWDCGSKSLKIFTQLVIVKITCYCDFSIFVFFLQEGWRIFPIKDFVLCLICLCQRSSDVSIASHALHYVFMFFGSCIIRQNHCRILIRKVHLTLHFISDATLSGYWDLIYHYEPQNSRPLEDTVRNKSGYFKTPVN